MRAGATRNRKFASEATKSTAPDLDNKDLHGKKQSRIRPHLAKIQAKALRSLRVALTAYDYSTAQILDGGVDVILVGDSLAMVALGHRTTQAVTVATQMLHHARAVTRACRIRWW